MRRYLALAVAAVILILATLGAGKQVLPKGVTQVTGPITHKPIFTGSPHARPNFFVHRVSKSNVVKNWTLIDNPLTNQRPGAVIVATPNWNPDGKGGKYNNHPIGVWYTDERWAIFNQDLAPMEPGLAFNVWVARIEPAQSSRNPAVYRVSTTNGDLEAIWAAIESLQVAIQMLEPGG